MALTFHADALPIAPAPARDARLSLIPIVKAIGIALTAAAFVTGLWLAPLLALRAAGTLDPAQMAMSCAEGWVMRFDRNVPTADETPFSCFPAQTP